MAFYTSNAGRVYNVLLERNSAAKTKVVSTDDIRAASKFLKLEASTVLPSLIRSGVIEPVIFKGIYYVRDREERDLKKIKADPLETIAEACNIRLGETWYFGLATALKLSGEWEQQTLTTATVISKKRVQRSKTSFAGMAVEFKQLSSVPFGEQVQKDGAIRYSKPPRTILDYFYFSARNSESKEYARIVMGKLLEKNQDREKILDAAARLAEKYPGLYQQFLKTYLEK